MQPGTSGWFKFPEYPWGVATVLPNPNAVSEKPEGAEGDVCVCFGPSESAWCWWTSEDVALANFKPLAELTLEDAVNDGADEGAMRTALQEVETGASVFDLMSQQPLEVQDAELTQDTDGGADDNGKRAKKEKKKKEKEERKQREREEREKENERDRVEKEQKRAEKEARRLEKEREKLMSRRRPKLKISTSKLPLDDIPSPSARIDLVLQGEQERAHIKVRNAALRAWHKDSEALLTADHVNAHLDEKYHAYTPFVIRYLERQGRVNFGVFKAEQPTADDVNEDSAPSVIIVGGGFAGLLCAHHLIRQGVKVLILEAGEKLGGSMVPPQQSNSLCTLAVVPRKADRMLEVLLAQSHLDERFFIAEKEYLVIDTAEWSGVLSGGMERLAIAGSRVTKIVQSESGVQVHVGDVTYQADRAIVATPFSSLANITFEPTLADDMSKVEENHLVTYACRVTYESKVWKKSGFVLEHTTESGDVVTLVDLSQDGAPTTDVFVSWQNDTELDVSAVLSAALETEAQPIEPPVVTKTDTSFPSSTSGFASGTDVVYFAGPCYAEENLTPSLPASLLSVRKTCHAVMASLRPLQSVAALPVPERTPEPSDAEDVSDNSDEENVTKYVDENPHDLFDRPDEERRTPLRPSKRARPSTGAGQTRSARKPAVISQSTAFINSQPYELRGFLEDCRRMYRDTTRPVRRTKDEDHIIVLSEYDYLRQMRQEHARLSSLGSQDVSPQDAAKNVTVLMDKPVMGERERRRYRDEPMQASQIRPEPYSAHYPTPLPIIDEDAQTRLTRRHSTGDVAPTQNSGTAILGLFSRFKTDVLKVKKRVRRYTVDRVMPNATAQPPALRRVVRRKTVTDASARKDGVADDSIGVDEDIIGEEETFGRRSSQLIQESTFRLSHVPQPLPDSQTIDPTQYRSLSQQFSLSLSQSVRADGAEEDVDLPSPDFPISMSFTPSRAHNNTQHDAVLQYEGGALPSDDDGDASLGGGSQPRTQQPFRRLVCDTIRKVLAPYLRGTHGCPKLISSDTLFVDLARRLTDRCCRRKFRELNGNALIGEVQPQPEHFTRQEKDRIVSQVMAYMQEDYKPPRA
eukprot:PhM_4_TR15958/c1_g1_i1/m.102776